MNSRVVIAGGSGFIGTYLSERLAGAGYEVVVLSRSMSSPPRTRAVPWDGKSVGAWLHELDGATALINLAGRSINCRHSEKNLREIRDSRVHSVHALAAALSQVQNAPPLFLQASAVGFYGDSGDRICIESSPAGTDKIAQICAQWENALSTVAAPNVRQVVLRLGVVLGNEGGFFSLMSRLTRLFLGGSAGKGNQFVSWIHIDDDIHMVLAAIKNAEVSGTYNACSPNPVTNRQLMEALRAAWHRPWSPPVPEFAIRLGGWITGTNGDLALTSQRAIPEHFLRQDFPFRFREIRPAVQDLVERRTEKKKK
jgi:uncharacterized protein (TIGR01777 family)